MAQVKPLKALRTQLLRSAYPRLYFGILVIMVLVSLLRYHLLIRDIVAEAVLDRTQQLVFIEKYVPDDVFRRSLHVPGADIQAVLDGTLAMHSSIQSLEWSLGRSTHKAERPALATRQVPKWFASLATLPEVRKDLQIMTPDGSTLRLVIVVRGDQYLTQGWRTVVRQLPVSLLIICIVFGLLTVLVRINARMLRRLDHATNALRAGALGTRMQECGTLEMRAVARTFNAMAAEIQKLVLSLRATRSEHGEQVHFTHQLIHALPLPIFVRGPDGTCLGVNKAWEDYFDQPSSAVVGRHMRSDFADVFRGQAHGRRTRPARKEVEVRLQVNAQEVRDLAYYKAPFTLRNGTQAGTIGALVDITDRKHAQAALHAEKERAIVTLSSIADGVITTNGAGRVDSMNEAAQHLTGYLLAHAAGLPLAAIFRRDPGSQPLPQDLEVCHLHLAQTPVHALNQVLVHRSGERYAIEFTASPIRQADGNITGCVLVFRDVTEAKELQNKISWQARHDVLTGLNNRIALAERLTHALFQTRETQQNLAVCLLDLDHFQQINEAHGQWIGDRLLKEVALRLRSIIKDSEDIARLGGDEFVVLLRGADHEAQVTAQLRALLLRLSQPYAIDDLSICCTASVGVSLFPLDDGSPDLLLRHADQAMYLAKQAGRGGLHLFDARHDQEVQTTHNRVARIRQALLEHEFLLHYQPKVHMRSREIVGFEALLRWQHPKEGLQGPHQFLPLIEHTDLIVDTGNWVLNQALRQLQEWVQRGLEWKVSVNIAARHFHRPDFVNTLQTLFAQYPGVPPRLLELEILESTALEDIRHMRQVMQECQALGVSFALDDFGTGFSSLSYLKCLPAETIKIDRTFVEGILTDPEDSTLVSAIVGLARAFDRTVIAEGVETEAQADKLLSLGCEWGQGYGIARPMPAPAVLTWARERAAVLTAL
nr:EAL domain-containing protein [uncultured Rhodoferax sp.]